jgi:hypothetical protein
MLQQVYRLIKLTTGDGLNSSPKKQLNPFSAEFIPSSPYKPVCSEPAVATTAAALSNPIIVPLHRPFQMHLAALSTLLLSQSLRSLQFYQPTLSVMETLAERFPDLIVKQLANAFINYWVSAADSPNNDCINNYKSLMALFCRSENLKRTAEVLLKDAESRSTLNNYCRLLDEAINRSTDADLLTQLVGVFSTSINRFLKLADNIEMIDSGKLKFF